MSFKLGDIIVDRIQYAWISDFQGNALGVLTQLADGSINITADGKEAVDSTNTLVKKFWQGKKGEFTAQNAFLNLNAIGLQSGSEAEMATETSKLEMPKIVIVKQGSTVKLKDYVEGTVKINGLETNGSMDKVTVYTKGSSAAASTYTIDSEGILTPPTDAAQYIVKYTGKSKNGAIIRNKADKFPGTVRMLLKTLAVDPCSADTVKSLYVELPSLQLSPETQINLTTDGKLDFKGDLQVD